VFWVIRSFWSVVLIAIELTPAAGQLPVARETAHEPSLRGVIVLPPERPLSLTVIRLPSLDRATVTALAAFGSVSV
jgi:hypothetical protein